MRISEKKKHIVIVFLFVFSMVFASPAQAAKTLDDAAATLGTVVGPTGVSTKSIQVQVGDIIRIALSITGTIFFVLMVYAGFKWMTARGNEEAVTKARGTLIAAVIGLAIVVGAYSVTVFVTNRLLGQAEQPGGVCISLCGTLSPTACGTASQFCEVQGNVCTQKGGDDCGARAQAQCTTPCEWQAQ
jgi:FtsH-binding integral membrane protein